MFHLYLKNESISSFISESKDGVIEDYFNYCIEKDCNPRIERIEKCDENGNTIEIILGDLIQDWLDERINIYKYESESERAGLEQAQKEALGNNWRL